MLKLVTPGQMTSTGPAASSHHGHPMHFRFEINYIADEVAGRFPQVKILQIAWHDKRQHVRRFLLDYYAKYRCLPSGRHDLGRTGVHHLSMGIIDFDRVRGKIQIEIDYRRQAGASRRNRILSAAGRLGIRRLLSEIATTAGWRGCKS